MALTIPHNCLRTPVTIVSQVADERVRARLGDDLASRISRFSHTAAGDTVSYPGNRSVWFQGHTGGAGNGEYAQFDARANLLARCMHFDTGEGIQVERAAAAPPYIPRAVLAFATGRGLRIGSPLAAVERVYGKAHPQKTRAGTAYAYESRTPMAHSSLPFVVSTVFFVRHGRVAAIVRIEGL